MAPILVPHDGLTLAEPALPKPDNDNAESGSMPTQAMLLDLDDGVLDEVLKIARNGGKGVSVAFGKTIMLNYGTKSQRLIPNPSPSHAQLYTYSKENETELAFAGRLSHKLAMQKAQEDITGADKALEKLQSQLAGYKQEKASNQIKFVQNNPALPPPHKQIAASLKQRSTKSNIASFLKKNNTPARFGNDTTRSMPVSPATGASRTPLSQKPTPTSVPALPNGRARRLQSLRTPLIHFLAARPASSKLLSTHLNCKEEDLIEVLLKVGKKFRLDESKWDLNDKAFKELDLFAFDYPNEGDRELATGRAISAFDRMRISTSEKIWDKLMPKRERGKGKVLSALKLNKGPISSSNTPRIQVQEANDDSQFGLDGNESDRRDRLAPRDAEPGRSCSQGPIKKKKVSEKEAQSKRLLSKGPRKNALAPKEKEAQPAVKKGAKKTNVPKSSEFVNESDEEDGLEDAATLHARSQPPKNSEITAKDSKVPEPSKPAVSTPKVKASKPVAASQSRTLEVFKPAASTPKMKAAKPATASHSGTSTPIKKQTGTKAVLAKRQEVVKPAPAMTSTKEKEGSTKENKAGEKVRLPANAPEDKPSSPASFTASSPAPKHKTSDASQGGTAMKKTISRQRNTSSPHKPSPLGSSPPTNASDLDNNTTSSKSSTPMVRKNTTPNGVASAKGHSRNVSEHSSISPAPLVREDNATPNGITSVNGAGNTSEHTLKRKAGDLDSGIHNHGSPLTNGNVNGYTNGNTNPSKRQKTSEMTPPTSDSGDSPLARDAALKKAADFKRYYDNYKKQYIEVSQMENPPREKLDEVIRMHNRLAEMKEQINRALAT